MSKNNSPIQKDSVSRLKKFFEASSEGLFFHDQGRILDINPGVTSILGYKPGEITGKNLIDFVAPDFKGEVLRRMQGNNEETYETKAIHADGDHIPVMVRAYSLESNGESIRVVALNDISDQKQVEESLQQRNREVIQNVPGVVYQILVKPDKTLEIPYISDGIEEITGMSSEEVIANPALAFSAVLKEDLPAVQAEIIGTADRMEQSSIVFRMKDSAGVIRWFHSSSRPRLLEDGSILKNGILLDITEKKIAEQALENSQQNFTALAENSKDGFLVNLNSKHVFANTSLALMLGYESSSELIGTSMEDIFHPDEVEKVLEAHRKRKGGVGATDQYETLFRHKNGSPVPVELNANMTIWDGQSAGMVTVRDISERQHLQEELNTHKENLEKLVEQRSTELHESEARLTHLLSSSPTVMYTCEASTDFPATFVSGNVQELFGFSSNQFLNEPGFWAKNIHPEDAPRVFENLPLLFDHDSHAHEYRFKLNDGSYIWVHDELRLLRNQDGSPQEIVGTWSNVTDRKVAEEKFRTLFELSDDANMILDRDAFIDCNEATLTIFGCTNKEEFLGKHPGEMSPVKQLDGIDSRISADQQIAIAYERGSNLFEWTHRRMTGENFPAEVLLKPMIIEGKEVLQAIVRDITSRKDAEDKIRQSSELYRDLYESIPLAYFIANDDGTFAECNPRAMELLGYTKEELSGMPIIDIYADAPSGKIKAQAINEEVLSGRTVTGEEVQLKRSDGKSIWVSMSVQPSTPGHKRRALVEDISERKEGEKQLIQAKEEAEAANSAKSEFLSRMSHELRTPLNAILGFGQLMQMGSKNLSTEQVESIKHIVQGGEHLLHLINEILDISKVDAGEMELLIEPVSFRNSVESSFTLVRPLALKKEVKLNVDLNLCDFTLKADLQRLTQALVNLLANAIKYGCEGGEVTLLCKQTDGPNKQPMIRIEIVDNGIGIKESDYSRIFEPFQRVTVRGAPIEGTGIGLAITQKMIRLMQGEIGFESEYGKGSTFWFELPLVEASIDVTAKANVQTGNVKRLKSDKKILYVEDNAANRKLVTQLLNRFTDCKLLCAENAESGIDIAKDQLPDLILMDIGLPGMDGFEALKVLQGDEQTSHIPVVAVTAHAMPDFQERGLKAGFQNYLTKPIEMNKLLATIENIRNQ